jgi:hypothetical protein
MAGSVCFRTKSVPRTFSSTTQSIPLHPCPFWALFIPYGCFTFIKKSLLDLKALKDKKLADGRQVLYLWQNQIAYDILNLMGLQGRVIFEIKVVKQLKQKVPFAVVMSLINEISECSLGVYFPHLFVHKTPLPTQFTQHIYVLTGQARP